MKRHIFGLKPEELKFEIVRVLKKLGFEIREVEEGLIGVRGSDEVRVRVRDIGQNPLGIPQTEAVFECEEDIYNRISSHIIHSNCLVRPHYPFKPTGRLHIRKCQNLYRPAHNRGMMDIDHPLKRI